MRNNDRQRRERQKENQQEEKSRPWEERLPRKNSFNANDLTPWNAVNCIIAELRSKGKLKDYELPIQYK